MNIIFLKNDLLNEELKELREEFSQYEFLSQEDFHNSPLTLLKTHYWNYVEVLYSHSLSPKEIEEAHQLRWIHTPSSNLENIAIQNLMKKKNIILTKTPEPNALQMSEFVTGIILAFGKRLFHLIYNKEGLLKNTQKEENANFIWKIQNRILLQVGLGTVGSAIAEKAYHMGIHTWGISKQRSFHPYCHKTFSPNDMHSLLPVADIVCLCLPKDKSYNNWFKQTQLELMKNDSILIVLSPRNIINEKSLKEVAKTGKFRGVFLETSSSSSRSSPAKDQSNIFFLPSGIIQKPTSKERTCFKIFKHNLRHYIHGNFNDMKNIIGKTLNWEIDT